MKKAWIAAAGGAALLGSAVVGGAAFTGVKVKKELQAAASSLPAQWPMVKVVEQQYERGLFSATHAVTLQFGCEADAKDGGGPLLLTLRQRVQHGPLPGFAGVGAAVIDTEVVLPEASRKAAAAVLGDKSPLTAHTVVGFDGASRTQLAMPAFKFAGPQGQQIEFQGLAGEIDAQADRLRYDVKMPALSLRATDDKQVDVTMVMSGARAHGELRGTGSVWLRAGRGEAEIAALQISAAPRAGQAAPPLTMAFKDLKVSNENTLEKDLLASVGRLGGSGAVNGFKIDKLEMQASVKRLHAPSYERLLQRLMDTSASACGLQQAVSPQVFMAQVQQDFVALLPYNPEYAMDKLVIESGGKRAEFSYALGIEGATVADLNLPLPALAMSKGKLRGHAKLPVAWVEQMMHGFAGAAGQPPADAAAQAEMMNVMLARMTGDGFVVREGDMLSTQISVDKGQVLVNGKPLGKPQ